MAERTMARGSRGNRAVRAKERRSFKKGFRKLSKVKT
jgi:hypothetical protein